MSSFLTAYAGKQKQNPLLSYNSAWLHHIERVSMTDRLREEGGAGTLKEDMIQLMILSIYMEVCNREEQISHLQSVCLLFVCL